MQDVLSEKLHPQIQSLSDAKMAKIKDMMKIRVHFYHDLNHHTYFFEQPKYDTERAAKFLKKLSQPKEVKVEILGALIDLFDEIKDDAVSSYTINDICSEYLRKNEGRGWKNEDVFFLLRYAISGNPVGAPTGEICEVIGLQQVILRCHKTIEYLNQ